MTRILKQMLAYVGACQLKPNVLDTNIIHGRRGEAGFSGEEVSLPDDLSSEKDPVAHDKNDIHFATGHLLTGLKARTVSSGIVTTLGQGALLVLNLGSIMVLARLLTPLDFGLVAMVSTVMGFFRPFNEAGLSTATVQKDGITQAQVSNLFWTNVGLGLLISVILAVSAPAVAWFYREPRLLGVTIALSLTFLFTSSTVQHLALLKRQMRFETIAFIQVVAAVVGVSVGIGMAWFNFGYWCLVGMQLSTPIAAMLLTWMASRWRPQLPVRNSGTRSLLRFGADLTASSFLWSLARGSDGLLIGRFFGSAALGVYSRAGALLQRPMDQAMAPLEAVLVPTFSRLQSQPERYRRIVLQVCDIVAVAGFLFSSLLLAVAYPLTLVVLGAKWESAAPIFAAFTLVAVYVPLTSVAGWVLASQGRGKDFLKLSSICSAVTAMFFLIGVRFGPIGVALSYSLSCLMIHLPVAFHFAGRGHLVATKDLWTRFFTHLPLWGVVYCTTRLAHPFVVNSEPFIQVVVLGLIGLLTGAAFIWLYPPSRRAVLNLFGVFGEWRIRTLK